MAIQTALFSKVMADRPLDEVAELAADIGYDGIEPMGRDPHLGHDWSLEAVDELADHLADLGLDVPCLGSYTGNYVGKSTAECEAELDKLETHLEYAERLDCDIVRHGPGGPPVRDATDEQYEHAATWLRNAADLAADYGITLGIEIHAHTLAETVDATQRLLRAIGRDNVGAIHDAGNMYIVEEPFGPESVEQLGDDLVHVHVKEEARVDDPDLPGAFELETDAGEELFQPHRLGEGEVDHGPLFDALADHGYDGFVTDECHVPTEDDGDIEVARHELTELRTLLDGSN